MYRWITDQLQRRRNYQFAQPIHMCFEDLEKASDHVPRGVL